MKQVHIAIATTPELEKPIIEVYDNQRAAEKAAEEIEHQNGHVNDLEVYTTTRRVGS